MVDRTRFTISAKALEAFLLEHSSYSPAGITLSRDLRDAAELLCEEPSAIGERRASYRELARLMLHHHKARPSLYNYYDDDGKHRARQAYYGITLSQEASTRLAKARGSRFNATDAMVVVAVLDGGVPLSPRQQGEPPLEQARRTLCKVDSAFNGLTNNNYWDGERKRWIADRLIPRLALSADHLADLAGHEASYAQS